jgi:hypothetical protein
MQAVARHWGELPVREQLIVVLDYYRGMTQARIGQQLGISQMHVSRGLARAVDYIRPGVFGRPGYVAGAVPGPVPALGTARAASPMGSNVSDVALERHSRPGSADTMPSGTKSMAPFAFRGRSLLNRR